MYYVWKAGRGLGKEASEIPRMNLAARARAAGSTAFVAIQEMAIEMAAILTHFVKVRTCTFSLRTSGWDKTRPDRPLATAMR